MKIGVIGTFIRDHIVLANGGEADSYGGIFYTVSMLTNLVSSRDEIYPICNLGADLYDDIISRLTKHPSINITGIQKVASPNTAVKLVYQTAETREEYLSHRLPPLSLDHIRSVGAMDGWLVNFITGFELSLETLRQFRREASGLIVMDFHSLSLAIEENGHRIFRQLPDWPQWIQGMDVLQMNEAEAMTLMARAEVSEDELIDFGHQVLASGIQIFNITRGSSGSLLFFKDHHQPCHQKIPAYPIAEVVDVTGCGDAFAAGFLVHYLVHHDAIAATYYANRVAGLNCSLSGTDELFKLKRLLSNSNLAEQPLSLSRRSSAK